MSHPRLGRLAAADEGPRRGPAVVCVHGSMDRMAGFAKVARRLTDTWRVVRYDRRGYGHSAPHPGPFDIDENVADLLEVIAHVASDVVLVGHSLGGNIALAAAQHTAAVRAVAVYECPLSWTDWWPGTSAGATALREATATDQIAEVFMVRMIGHERWERLPEAVRATRRAEGAALAGEIAALQAAPPWDPARIHVPVLAGSGSEGREHHRRGMEVLAGWIDGARLVSLPGCGHMAHTTDPDLFTDLLVRPLLEEPR